MSIVTIHEFINDQDIKQLAEDIVLGPQAEVLTMLEQFNDRWRTELGITKKFRWKPGTHPEYKKKAAELLHITNKANSLARIHWRVADSRYYFERMGNQINDIENKLYYLRNNDLMFQDNTEYVEKALAFFLNVAKESEDVWNMNIRQGSTYRELEINTVINVEHIKVRLGESVIQEIPVPPISLRFILKFDTLLNSHSRIISGDKGRLKIGVGSSGMIIDNDYQVLHPYVSGGGGYGQTRRPSTDYVHTCFGDLTSEIFHTVYVLDWENAEWLLNRWASNYTINITNPLNNIKGSYHGQPSYLTEEYMDVVGHSVNDCNYPNIFRNTITDEVYCDKVDCSLKQNCVFYNTEINITLSDIDLAALYYIAEEYHSIYNDDDTMPDTVEEYYEKIHNIWTRYKRDDNLSFKMIYESMQYMDEGLKELL